MSSSTLTILGLKNYLDYFEKDIFENLTLPSGIDKEDCINNILSCFIWFINVCKLYITIYPIFIIAKDGTKSNV